MKFFGNLASGTVATVLIFGTLILNACDGGGSNSSVVANETLENGYYDMYVPVMQSGKVDSAYLEQSGDDIVGRLLLGDEITGTVSGDNISLLMPSFSECTEYSGVISGAMITGTCTQGTGAGTELDFEKSIFHISNFAPNDYLSTLTPPVFSWTEAPGADAYMISVMLDNDDGDCDEQGDCVGIWTNYPIYTTDVEYNEDGGATAPLLDYKLYRVNQFCPARN
jgi:hypothetical protein